MDPLRPGLGGADKSLGQQQASGPLGLGAGSGGPVGAEPVLPRGPVCAGGIQTQRGHLWVGKAWGKLESPRGKGC